MTNVIPISPFGDRPVIVVGGGPSLTLSQVRLVGIARAQDRCRVIAVNDSIFPCWFADWCHIGDDKLWRLRHGLPRYPGMKTSICPTEFKDVRAFKNAGPDYVGDEGMSIGGWKNSGGQAVQIAARLFARRILLLGLDYSGSKETKDGTMDHWFGRYEEKRFNVNSDVAEIKRLFRVLTDHLQSRGVEIVNCSPESTIDWLPRSTIESEFPFYA